MTLEEMEFNNQIERVVKTVFAACIAIATLFISLEPLGYVVINSVALLVFLTALIGVDPITLSIQKIKDHWFTGKMVKANHAH